VVTDISQGATLTLPDHGGRYLSVMAVNDEHYINAIYSQPGEYRLTPEEHGSDTVALFARIFVDPADSDDVAAVNSLQDALTVDAPSQRPFSHPDFEAASLDATRDALMVLGQGLGSSTHTFGSKSDVDPVRHLIGTAIGWGGLPETEAYYVIESEPHPVGTYSMILRDVPVDAFWSVTIYNRDGYLERNEFDSYSLNSVTAARDADGSVALALAPQPAGVANHLYVMDGWNYALRLYRPRAEVVDGSWTPPRPELVPA
jgi:hypothetical protein